MRKKTGKEGFIAIIALGIFALLSIFGIMVQLTVVSTFASVKDTNNYYQAKDIADSLIEYMQNELKVHEAGYNSGLVECTYNGGVPDADTRNKRSCDFLKDPNPNNANSPNMIGTHDVKISYEIKGRPTVANNVQPQVDEKVSTTKCHAGGANFNQSCYVTPFKDGDAGSRCNVYKPDANPTVPGLPNVDNLDYSCNWNKLTFGSSLTDRVAIPFYYDSSSPGQAPVIYNPFHRDANIRATQFLLRLRTPCLPCAANLEPGEVAPPGFRRCDPGADETVCEDAQRYVLKTGLNNSENDIVVQWQLGGMCTVDGRQQECGAISFPEKEDYLSAIYESMINRTEEEKNKTVIVNSTSLAQSNYIHPSTKPTVFSLLQKFTKPVLTLFLSKSLISDQGFNVPYLEYQVLTNKPIGNSKTKVNVINVNVDGSNFSESLYQEQSKPLIDFAIQN